MSDAPNSADAKVKRRLRRILGVLGALTALSLYDHYGHTARVYDGTTGKPLAGVFVVGIWDSTFTFWRTSTSCYQLRVAQTDFEGRYQMPYGSWSLQWLSLGSSSKRLIYYKRGYYVAQDDLGKEMAQMLLWPDKRPANERMWAIVSDQDDMQLCVKDEMAPMLIPVYEAMAQEATAIAVTPGDRTYARWIRYRLNRIRFGHPRADEIKAMERQHDEEAK